MEASPSPVYGARLLSGFGATTPSRVQIPPPPPAQPNSPPGSPAGSWRAPLLLQVCAKRICAVRFGGVDRDPSLTLDEQRPGRSSGSPRKAEWRTPWASSSPGSWRLRSPQVSPGELRAWRHRQLRPTPAGVASRSPSSAQFPEDPPPIEPETRTNSTPPHVWSQSQSPRPVSERGQRIRCPRCHLSG